jgi:hypothetical protein
MSLSSSGNQGYLDVTNAILRVGTLDVYGITGVDMVTNVVKQNAVLVWDDQGADMSTPPFQLGAGVTRTTSPPEIDLRNASGDNFMYHGLKLPNQWMAQFDLYLDTGTTGNVHLQMYTSSTTTYDDDGYQFIFDAANSTLTLEYDGTQVQQSAVTYTTGWQTFVVTFNRGAWGVARESDVVFSLDDDERSAVYDNTSGQYLRFETDATTSRKVRYLKFTNSGPWLQSKTGDISFLTGNVSVGHNTTTHKLSVAGSANVGALTATSVNVAGGVDATSTSTGDLTLTGLGVESNIHTSNLYASEYVGVGTASAEAPLNVIGSSDLSGTPNNAIASFRATTAIPGTNDAGVVIGSVNGNLPYIADVSSASLGLSFYTQNNKRMIIKSDGNVAIGTHDPQYKLDVAGTANVGAVTLNSNVYAPNLPLAEIASNLVTWDSATGDLMDSGGLISNKLAIVSEQPPAALTGDSTVVDGHGRYKVTSSLEAGAYEGYKVFDKTIGAGTTGWSTGAVSAYNVDGTYAGSNVIAGVSGEWVKIEFPYKTTLRHVSLSPNVYYSAMPENFSIVASNDDSNWTVIKSVTGQAWTSADYVNFVVNADVAYKYYAIVAQLTNTNYAYIGEWRLFTETFTVDAGVVSTTAASGLDVGYTEHPVAPMTDYKTYVEGHGTYEASASSYDSTYSLYPWETFDNNTSTRWTISTDDDNYNVSTGEWDQTAIDASPDVFTSDVGGTRYHGHWLQIKLPYTVTLSHTNIHPQTIERAPKDGVILGSNDGEAWYKLTEFSGKTYTASTWTRIDVNATTPYQYFRMCATKNGGDSKLELTEWRLFAEKPVTRMENVHISGELSSETLQTGYIKWPKVPLKAAESEGYVVSASSVENTQSQRFAFNAFNEFTRYSGDSYAPNWISRTGAFDSSGEAVNGTAASFDGNDCEWIQIKLPQSIRLSSFKIRERDISQDGPKSGFMYGSNDGVTWSKLATFNDISYDTNSAYIQFVNSSQSYSYFRVVVTKVTVTGTPRALIEEIALYEAATGVGAAPTSAKLQVAGSLGMAKGAEFFAGDDVVMELPKHDRPLTKYPEVAMTAASTGGYVASASSIYSSYVPFKAFNEITTIDESLDLYITDTGTYDTTDGTHTGSASLAGVPGEYLKLQLPTKINIRKVRMYTRKSPTSGNPPTKARIFGSNDDTFWTQLGVYENDATPYDGSSVDILIDAHTGYYKYFALLIEEVKILSALNSYACIAELEYYGYEEGDTSVDVVHRSIPNTPSPQHLEVYWDAADSNSYSFADSSNVYDLSGSGVTGAITGNNGFDAEYNAWVFDGSGDYISGTLSNPAGDWVHSVSCWVSATELSSTKARFISYYGVEALRQQVILYVSSGQISVDFNSDRIYKDVSPFALNTWYHIAFTYSGGGTSNVKIYINGVDVGASGGGTTALNIASGQTLYVGKELNLTYNDPWKGSIANFRLFGGKVLNADQVRELYEYDAPRFGHRQNLVALHKGNLGVGVPNPTSRFEVAGADGLQEFPPKAMTGYETYMEGHGVFRASASTNGGSVGNSLLFRPWKAFIKGTSESTSNGDNSWLDGSGDFNSVTGVYDGSLLHHIGSVSGEYLQLELPYEIQLSSYSLAPWNYPTGANFQYADFPRDFIIYGSKDYTNWDVVDTRSSQSSTSQSDIKTYNINSLKTYKYFAIVITKINTATYNNSAVYVAIGEWRLFGTPAPSALEDGHLTLGKALTLPRVSGHPAGAETPRAASLVVHYDTTVDSVVSGSTVVDISGNGLNGTLFNGAAYSSTDRAFTFDGVDDYVYDNSPSGLPTGDAIYSISAWVNIYTYTSSSTVFAFGSAWGCTTMGSMYIANNQLAHSIGCNQVYTTNQTITSNTWHHVVVVKKGTGANSVGNIDLYVDGLLITDKTVSGTATQNIGTASFVTVGAGSGPSELFNGKISKPKLWNVALTAEEVAAEYALGRTGKSLNLTDTALCLGGTVPRAQLDVRGMALINNREYGLSGVTYDRGSWSGGTSVELGRMQPDLYNYHRIVVRFGGIASVTQRFNARIRARHTGSSSFETSGYESISSMIKKNDNTSLTNLYNGSDGPLVNYYSDGGATGGQDNLLIIDVSSKRENRAQVQFTCSWTYGNIGYSQSFGGFHRSGASYDKIKLYLEDFDVNNVITSSSGDYTITGYI